MLQLQSKKSPLCVAKQICFFTRKLLETKAQLLLIFSLLLLGTSNLHANAITEVLSGSDNGFGFSGLHHARGCNSMCGSSFSDVSLSNQSGHNSYFHESDLTSGSNFLLYLTLDNFGGSLLTLNGSLNFNVAVGELIGTLNADFTDENIHADTVFKFVKGTANVGGVNVPKPNGINDDLLSLWGANSDSNHVPGSIGFASESADLGIDLALKWANVPEPSSLFLMCFGLMFIPFKKYNSIKKWFTV